MEWPTEETSRDDRGIISTEPIYINTFCHSSLASGVPTLNERRTDRSEGWCRTVKGVTTSVERENSIRAHKIAFALLHQMVVDLSDSPIGTVVVDVANVIALAEYYDFLPCIASAIEVLLSEHPKMW